MSRRIATTLLSFTFAILASLGLPRGAEAACEFRLGFRSLRDQIPERVGQCLENEHFNTQNGDSLQRTTGGLLVWRKVDNWTAFTDGARTWINGPFGLQSRLNSERFSWEQPAADSARAAPPASDARAPATADNLVSSVAGHLDAFWKEATRSLGMAYVTPRVITFVSGQALQTGCGGGRLASHGYCARDRTIYLDTGTSNDYSLGTLLGQNMDFAVVTIVAHEWGHHVQAVSRGSAGPTASNPRAYELQADCYAGLFAAWARQRGFLDPGDIEEAQFIAFHSGDVAHGSGAQRVSAFNRGLAAQRVSGCA
ncbi:MAG: neutral zinc metallopeptidase [Chloroflexota bacterium]